MTSAARRAARSVASRAATSERSARTFGARTSIAVVAGSVPSRVSVAPMAPRAPDSRSRASAATSSRRGSVSGRDGDALSTSPRRGGAPIDRRAAPAAPSRPRHELALVVALATAGQPVVRREVGDPVAVAVGDPQPDGRLEGVTPRGDRARRIGPRSIELLVALADQSEGVVVVAHPDVQPVLLDAPERATRAGRLAAEPTAALVHGDGVEALRPVAGAELPRCRQPGHPATEDGDLAWHRQLGAASRAANSAMRVAQMSCWIRIHDAKKLGAMMSPGSARRTAHPRSRCTSSPARAASLDSVVGERYEGQLAVVLRQADPESSRSSS